MAAWWTKTVGVRLVGSAIALLGLIMFCSGWYNIESQRTVLLGSIERQGELMSQLAAFACRAAMLMTDYEALVSYTDALVGEADQIVFAHIERANGDIVAEAGRRSEQDARYLAIHRGMICVSLDGKKCEHDAVSVPDDHEFLGHVVLGMSTRPIEAAVAASRRNILYQAGVTFVCLAILLLIVLKFLVGDPLRQLDREARRLGRGDLDHEIRLRTHDEFGRLAHSLDAMRVGLRDSYREIQEQNDRLRQLDRLKSEFLANVSHEIRTPMNSILGFSELLTDMELGSEQREMIEMVRRSAQGLLTIINDILDFSKSEAGKLCLEEIPADIRRIVEDVARQLSSPARKNRIQILTDVDPALPQRVRADPTRLWQVLLNLAGNAVKFTEHGEVVLRAIVVEEHAERVRIGFEVRDTGIGIDPDVLPKLFSPFIQADGSMTRTHGGTGLGLAISQRLVDLMGGRISVATAPGKGSRFSFELDFATADATAPEFVGAEPPRHPEALLARVEDEAEPHAEPRAEPHAERTAPAARPTSEPVTPQETPEPVPAPGPKGPRAPDPAAAADRPRCRVLLVEDNPINQKVAVSMLRRLSCDVDIAGNGVEALAIAERPDARYDIVFMDRQMPEMDGDEATRQMRRLPGPMARVPIVAITASIMDSDREKCMAAGMDDFLSKPIDLGGLRSVLARWVHKTLPARP